MALNALQLRVEQCFVGLVARCSASCWRAPRIRTELRPRRARVIDDPARRCAFTFADGIHLEAGGDGAWRRLLALLHALDHLQRLEERLDEDEARALVARELSVVQTASARDFLGGAGRC